MDVVVYAGHFTIAVGGVHGGKNVMVQTDFTILLYTIPSPNFFLLLSMYNVIATYLVGELLCNSCATPAFDESDFTTY